MADSLFNLDFRRGVIMRFDDARMGRFMGEIQREIFSHFGAFVAKIAHRSIRQRKRPSLPGQPPSSHLGTLRDKIGYAYDPVGQRVIAGPVGLGRAKVPRILELGGNAVLKPNARRTLRVLGGSGEIRLGGSGPSSKPLTKSGGTDFGRRLWIAQVSVTYAKLRTPAQVDRANRLNQQIYGPGQAIGRGPRIAPRPYMAPAFKKGIERLPQFIRQAGAKATRTMMHEGGK